LQQEISQALYSIAIITFPASQFNALHVFVTHKHFSDACREKQFRQNYGQIFLASSALPTHNTDQLLNSQTCVWLSVGPTSNNLQKGAGGNPCQRPEFC
jgi:hypothetical protein